MLGRIIGIPGKKIYRWYKEVLSKYADQVEQKELHEHDTIDSDLINRSSGEVKKVDVPIFKPENFGEDMAIDDKNIGGEGYTVLSNKDTGKIALMIQSTKSKIIIEVLSKIPIQTRLIVKTITKDLAEGYDWVARTCFWNATRIADKFHVIKYALEALQDIRVRYRQEIFTEERIRREEIKARERERREQCLREGQVYKPKKLKNPPQKKYANGESKKELLARSRYLLFKFQKDWAESQAQRAQILFKEFPEIKKGYNLICLFRLWYKGKLGEVEQPKQTLRDWYKQVGNQDIEEINNFVSFIERHEGEILNYFKDGHTNAFAESLNSQIQHFVNSNSGTRDRDFFHYRLKKYFS